MNRNELVRKVQKDTNAGMLGLTSGRFGIPELVIDWVVGQVLAAGEKRWLCVSRDELLDLLVEPWACCSDHEGNCPACNDPDVPDSAHTGEVFMVCPGCECNVGNDGCGVVTIIDLEGGTL